MKLAWMVVVLSVSASSAARADMVEVPATKAPEPAPAAPAVSAALVTPAAPAPPKLPSITVMLAPIRLVIPVGEVTVEYRIMDQLGVSIELGGGKRTISTGNTDVTGTELEGGAQVRYYLLGDFHKGVELGAEILDEYVKFKEPLPAGVAGAAAGGVTVGPFVGYKIATHVGFTFEGQLGARYLAVDPVVAGQGMPTIDSRWMPLLHLNVGWSF